MTTGQSPSFKFVGNEIVFEVAPLRLTVPPIQTMPDWSFLYQPDTRSFAYPPPSTIASIAPLFTTIQLIPSVVSVADEPLRRSKRCVEALQRFPKNHSVASGFKVSTLP